MDVKQIKKIGSELRRFLSQFDDCFARSEPRRHLRTYVRGQLSDLPRKSVEPIALAAKTPPRTLQRFLSSVEADDERLVRRMQWMIARDHADPQAIGTIDDTGNPKKGTHTPGVQRQWCGNTGKIDNCVVTVHIGYSAGDFHCLLDSDVYLPKSWADDCNRRTESHVPDDIVYRKKTDIALAQIDGALINGIRVAAWTFDEFYGRDGAFLDGLDARGQTYVCEVAPDFTGWVCEPRILQAPPPQEAHKRGRKRLYPRLAAQAADPSRVKNLATYSPVFRHQSWQKFKVKDGENGPMVWEVKHAEFYRKQDDGLPGAPHTLIVARNVLNPDEVKYFLANRALGAGNMSLEWMLWVAFSRWPIERCFEVGKRDLGLDHFEARNWGAIHRHLYISQLSLLFCARLHQRLREKNSGQSVFDRRAGAPSGRRVDCRPALAAANPTSNLSADRRADCLLPTTQLPLPAMPYETNSPTTEGYGH